MSESTGYEKQKCHFCKGFDAGYQRRETYAGTGPWFDACHNCAKKSYEQPKQFQENTQGKI